MSYVYKKINDEVPEGSGNKKRGSCSLRPLFRGKH